MRILVDRFIYQGLCSAPRRRAIPDQAKRQNPPETDPAGPDGEGRARGQARNARGGPRLVTAYFLRWCIRRDGRHSVYVDEYGGRLARLGSQ